ncbi:MAG: molybdopterin molybdenumtransferase MoeA [Anaerolineae bacterium]|nr:molybdopterin molybdenumtransferase MoeA [Anaerolineae bacterium]
MPEFFTLIPPDEARARWFDALSVAIKAETVAARDALGRVLAETTYSPEALPAFRRSTVDGYAVRGADTYGASDALPVYLEVVGEVMMGRLPEVAVGPAQAALVHTGGAVPEGADAVVMVENTQPAGPGEIEVLRRAAAGENVIQVGEDIRPGAEILPAGHTLRPQDLGGLLALGITEVKVARRPVLAIIATGDEIIAPGTPPMPGQVRDINTYTIGAQTQLAGGEPLPVGIVPDRADALRAAVAGALARADGVILSAGSSVSVRDLTATVINDLGKPGVLVHGVAVRPGKPTILGVIDGKPVMGLPGNPVSAMNVYRLFGVPLIRRLLGAAAPARRTVAARLAVNGASAAGREDYISVRLRPADDGGLPWAEPVFGKSNLIYTLVHAEGVVKVSLDATGLYAGTEVEVELF